MYNAFLYVPEIYLEDLFQYETHCVVKSTVPYCVICYFAKLFVGCKFFCTLNSTCNRMYFTAGSLFFNTRFSSLESFTVHMNWIEDIIFNLAGLFCVSKSEKRDFYITVRLVSKCFFDELSRNLLTSSSNRPSS